MIDPLAEVVTLLAPSAPFSKLVTGAGRWSVRRSEYGRPFYCVVIDGPCRLAVDGYEPVTLHANDFVLIPSADSFTMTSLDPASTHASPIKMSEGEFRHGSQDGEPDVRILVGYCEFGSANADLLVSLLPRFVHVRGETMLTTLVQLVRDEFRQDRPGRELILARLLEVLFIEALRSSAGTAASPGLVNGLADERIASALRAIHSDPTRSWTVAELAKESALSRSAFFDRFNRTVGIAPMEYLLAWRMALAQRLLRQREPSIAEVAQRVGYSSASTFTVAFTRFVGSPPARFARAQRVARANSNQAVLENV